jgi:hypothetical protein
MAAVWVGLTLIATLVQLRFDAYATRYCAQVERLLGNQETRTGQDEDSIPGDLQLLESVPEEKSRLGDVCVAYI